jgi:hypothetical protein
MSAGPQGPGQNDPTYVAGPGNAGPGYAPPPPADPRFERGAPGPSYPPGYQQDYGYDQHDGGHDRAAEAAAFARRHIRTPETKEFFKTSEFAVWFLTAVFTLIAAAISDEFGPRSAWLYVTIIGAAYIVSRGLAKAGARRAEPEHDRR